MVSQCHSDVWSCRVGVWSWRVTARHHAQYGVDYCINSPRDMVRHEQPTSVTEPILDPFPACPAPVGLVSDDRVNLDVRFHRRRSPQPWDSSRPRDVVLYEMLHVLCRNLALAQWRPNGNIEWPDLDQRWTFICSRLAPERALTEVRGHLAQRLERIVRVSARFQSLDTSRSPAAGDPLQLHKQHIAT